MKTEISIKYKSHRIIGDIIGATDNCDIFCLHGAGSSNRTRYETIRLALLDMGYSSCAFDFIGHGDTGGDLYKSNLKERTVIAKKVINEISSRNPITIIGSSMSGYTAVKLLEHFDVKCLILIVPAAYDEKAYELQFNHEFTNCISKCKSYNNSDAWQILNKYKGKILLITAEKDSVIPEEVINNYVNSSLVAKVELITVKNSPHKILDYMDKETNELIVNRIVETINI